jgi:hypothetical protein
MSIAHQSAMPTVRPKARQRGKLHPVPPRRPLFALAKVGGLLALTAFGAALAAGTVGLGLVMVLTSVAG